jgi:hypothetical protein
MIRAALLLCAGIIIAACFACTPALSPPPPPLGAALRPLTLVAQGCNPNDPGILGDPTKPGSFAPLVAMITPNYDPSSFSPPTVDGANLPTAQMQADLKAAFIAAPMSLRTALCSLDGIYIDPGSSGESWGFRTPLDPAHPATPLKRYIGLSASLWNPGPSAVPFHQYESQLLQWTLGNWSSAYFPGNFADPADSSQITVLAALAHEYGHIFWYDKFKPAGTYPSGTFDPGTPGTPGNPGDFCSGNFYVSWRRPVFAPPPWRTFGQIDVVRGTTNPTNEHLNAGENVSVATLYTDINSQNDANLFTDLRKLYGTSGRWASALAALSPDEDFVETFELSVLRHATPPVQSLALTIFYNNRAYQGGDVPGDDQSGNKTELGSKEACFSNLYLTPGR